MRLRTRFIRLILVFNLLFLLPSCSSVFETREGNVYNLVRNTTKIYVQENTNLSVEGVDMIVNGTSRYYPTLDLCIITLRKYPICLAHEVRHCLEGSWHDTRPNSDDC